MLQRFCDHLGQMEFIDRRTVQKLSDNRVSSAAPLEINIVWEFIDYQRDAHGHFEARSSQPTIIQVARRPPDFQ